MFSPLQFLLHQRTSRSHQSAALKCWLPGRSRQRTALSAPTRCTLWGGAALMASPIECTRSLAWVPTRWSRCRCLPATVEGRGTEARKPLGEPWKHVRTCMYVLRTYVYVRAFAYKIIMLVKITYICTLYVRTCVTVSSCS